MAADIKHIVLEKGSDYEAVGELSDDDGNIDISGDTFEAAVKENIDDADGDVKATFTFTIFQDAEDDNKWKYRRTMTDTTIDALTIKNGVWDQFRILPDLTRAKMLTGNITVTKKVTP